MRWNWDWDFSITNCKSGEIIGGGTLYDLDLGCDWDCCDELDWVLENEEMANAEGRRLRGLGINFGKSSSFFSNITLSRLSKDFIGEEGLIDE